MAYPQKVGRFAVQFMDMADKFQVDPQLVIRVKAKGRKDAHQIRLQFYAFRNAARKTGEITQFATLEAVEVLIDKETHVVTFQCKDYSEIAKALEEAFAEAGIKSSAVKK